MARCGVDLIGLGVADLASTMLEDFSKRAMSGTSISTLEVETGELLSGVFLLSRDMRMLVVQVAGKPDLSCKLDEIQVTHASCRVAQDLNTRLLFVKLRSVVCNVHWSIIYTLAEMFSDYPGLFIVFWQQHWSEIDQTISGRTTGILGCRERRFPDIFADFVSIFG